jgi:hypothetical protein
MKNSGVIARIKAAKPDATCCSAYESVRLPPISRSTPTVAICPNCRALNQTLRPRNPQNASMKTPAIRKRTPHISAGGMRSTAMSIAK